MTERRRTELISSKPHTARWWSGFTLIELILVLVMLGVVVALVLPATRLGSREAARRTQCRNNLKQIGLALHNYHDEYGELPPAYTVDADGTPLHSWRTLLLPYLDKKDLYDRLDLTKPWNAPENASEFEGKAWMQCPSLRDLPQSQTTYLAIVTDSSCLRPGRSLALSEITDGTSATIGVIEVASEYAVPWMEPRDADEATLLAVTQNDSDPHSGIRHAIKMDGAVIPLHAKMTYETVKALATAAGGETIDDE